MPVLRAGRGLLCGRYASLFVDGSLPALVAPRHGGFSPVSTDSSRRLFFMAAIHGGGGSGRPLPPQYCIGSGSNHTHRHSIGMSYSGGSPHKREGDEEVAAAAPPSSSSSSSSSSNSPGSTFKEALFRAEKSEDLHVSNYWGIIPKEIKREDGSQWPWHCFKPSDTYVSDTKIDLKKHHLPDSFIDKMALWTVKSLRVPTDLFFQKRYGCRAMMLETVAAVPGMVGGMLLHLRSLRRFEHSGGWIKALLDEAENERMHLMTFMEVVKPKWYERALVVMVQGIFFNAYFLLYILSPRLAHRITGYLEEEAIYSYTEYLKEIDNGHLPNVPAPAIAIDYWRLPKDSTIRDVVLVVRADEAHHRDVNHFAADVHEEGKKLNEAPAPIGYH